MTARAVRVRCVNLMIEGLTALPRACPRLYWHIETAGWDLLGHKVLPGRHADYPWLHRPAPAAAALAELQETTAPTDVPVKAAEQRWAAYAPPGTGALIAGDTLRRNRPELP